MKSTFAKIFELPDHQVLAVMEYNSDDDVHEIVQTTQTDVRISMTLGFKSQEACEKAFSEYNESMANKFIKAIEDMI